MARAPDQTANRAPDPDQLQPHLRERRDRIVRAAIELLEHGEYDRIQIRDVAERAGVALGTVYRYFTSKEHLYAAALLDWSKTYERWSRRADARSGTDADRIRTLLVRAVRAFERRPQFLRAEIALESSGDENARALFDQFAERHVAVMTSALTGIADDEAAAIVVTVHSVLAARLRSWALGRCSIEDVERSVTGAVDLIFSPPPGGAAGPTAP